MNAPFSRKQFALKLICNGVLPDYAWRAAGEVADHADDLADSALELRTRLGDPDALANQIVQAYRTRTLAGRHPILAFGVAPLPLFVVAIIGYWTVGLLLIAAASKYTEWAGLIALAIQLGSMCLPSMLLTQSLCKRARRAGLSWKSTILASLPVLLVTFVIATSISLNRSGLGHGTFMIGFCLPIGHLLGLGRLWPPTWMIWQQVGCVALPICTILLMFVRERRLARELLLQPTSHDRPHDAASDVGIDSKAKAA